MQIWFPKSFGICFEKVYWNPITYNEQCMVCDVEDALQMLVKSTPIYKCTLIF